MHGGAETRGGNRDALLRASASVLAGETGAGDAHRSGQRGSPMRRIRILVLTAVTLAAVPALAGPPRNAELPMPRQSTPMVNGGNSARPDRSLALAPARRTSSDRPVSMAGNVSSVRPVLVR